MPETYRSAHTGSIADLMRQRGSVGARSVAAAGDIEAQRIAASGNAWGNAIGNITQGVTGTLRDFAQQRADAPAQQMRQQQSDLLAKQLSALDAETAQKKIGELAQMVKASGYDPGTAEPVFRAIGTLSPDYAEPLMRSLMEPERLRQVTDTLITQTPGYKAPEGFNLSEGQTRFGPDGTPIANVPKSAPPVAAPQPFTLGEGQVRYNPDGTQVAAGPPKPESAPSNPTEASLAMMAAQGNTQAAQALATLRSLRAPQGPGPKPDYMWAKDPTTNTVRLMSTEEIRATGASQADTADMRNKQSGKKVAGLAVDAVRKLGDGIFTKIGPAQRVAAIKRGAEAVWGTDPEFRTYQDSRMALAGTLAVEQQGGRVSDADVKALWLPMVPDAFRDTKESYELKWKLIDAMRGVEGKSDYLSSDPNAGEPIQTGTGKPKG